MTEVFRIIDQFPITGRGIVYTIKPSKGAVLRLEDILFDLHGNQFQVKGVEMITRRIGDPPATSIAKSPMGVLLESIGGAEMQGRILVKALSNVSFLFCNHPLSPRKADEDYGEEYRAAGRNHPCALFSYEDLEAGKLSLYGQPIFGLTIYRGWMMNPALYRSFYSLLEERGIILINTPEEYERYHLLPGWYDDFKGETPETVWTSGDSADDVFRMAENLEGSFIIKDYVKSRKHEWYDACFIRDIRDKNAAGKIIRNFIQRQGSGLVGGVVLRKFEKLKQIGFHERSGMPLSEEYRVFIYAGKILALDHYWTESSVVPISDEEYRWIASVAARIKSNFVTVDIARKEDGSLMVMELGDGQVSGLQQLEADVFYGSFGGGVFDIWKRQGNHGYRGAM